jgi:hypothetical protein
VASGASVFEMPVEVIGMMAGLACGLGIVLWWLFFSRAAWSERIGAIVLMVVALMITYQLADVSIQGSHQGLMLPLYSIPVVTAALVIWAVATRSLQDRARRTWMVAVIVLACVPFVLMRTAGVLGAGSELHWRWTPTPEELLLARGTDTLKPLPSAPAPAPVEMSKAPVEANSIAASTIAADDEPPASPLDRTPATAAPASAAKTGSAAAAASNASRAREPEESEWPGFRGPNRDGVVPGLRINTDWSAAPPVQIWRRPIGPGWSSFAVHGDLLYTQEQRGEDEIVACYTVSTGEPVWRHRDPIRFYESNAGAGPRATPTLHDGRVYSMGATGVLNALDARTGALLWTRNAATDTGKTVPDWGIASSPLAFEDLVIVAVAGQLAAYDARTGVPRWTGQAGGTGYSSPHLTTIDGVPQVMLMRGARTISVAPSDGTLLWEHSSGPPANSVVQPALIAEGEVLIAPGDAMGGLGLHRIGVSRSEGGWKVEPRWVSRGLKAYFNDFVVHKGHAYGFDGSILASVDLTDGERKWKGGRYGNGQLVLLKAQDLLLVTSEEGALVLVRATPERFEEVAKVQVMNAKTWNHPVVVRDVLLVRNGEEMAAFRLPAIP